MKYEMNLSLAMAGCKRSRITVELTAQQQRKLKLIRNRLSGDRNESLTYKQVLGMILMWGLFSPEGQSAVFDQGVWEYGNRELMNPPEDLAESVEYEFPSIANS